MKTITAFFLLVASAPVVLALFGGGDAATEITQAANLVQLQSQKSQGNKQLTTQLRQTADQLRQLALARQAVQTFDVTRLIPAVPDRYAERLAGAFDLDGSRYRLERLKPASAVAPDGLRKPEFELRKRRSLDRQALLAQARAQLAEATWRGLQRDREQLDRLQAGNVAVQGTTQAAQVRNESTAAVLEQLLRRRQARIYRRQLEIERLSLAEQTEAERLARYRRSVAEARARLARIRTTGPIF